MSIASFMRDPGNLGIIPWRDESGPRNPFLPKGIDGAVDINVVRKARLRVVEGRGDFPLDMLRYDRAFVLTPIPHPQHPMYPRRGKLRVVVGFADSAYAPTADRWRSYGWEVLNIRVSPRQEDRLKNRIWPIITHCARCVCKMSSYTMSYFDRDFICDICEGEERTHPDFQLAVASERYALKSGEYHFKGIDWPGVGNRISG